MRGVLRTLALVPRALEAVLALPRIALALDAVRQNTDALPDILERLEKVEASTAALPEILLRLEAVETSTAAIAELDATLAKVAAVAEPLQGATLRLGRIADRWPQRKVPLRA